MRKDCGHTRDVGVEDVIFFDHVVDQLAALLVGDQDLPLRGISIAWARGGAEEHTSPRVVLRMVERMTAAVVSGATVAQGAGSRRTVARDVNHRDAHDGGGVATAAAAARSGRDWRAEQLQRARARADAAAGAARGCGRVGERAGWGL